MRMGIRGLALLAIAPGVAAMPPEPARGAERELIQALVRSRQPRETSTGFNWCESLKEPVAAYRRSTSRLNPSRVARFREAMDEQAAPSLCERSRFSAVAKALVESGAQDKPGSAAAKDSIRQAARSEPTSSGACPLFGDDADPLLQLVLRLFDPDAGAAQDSLPRLLESARGHEAFVFCEGTIPTAAGLAHLFAPVLWFSPDEPLRLEKATVPAPLPGAKAQPGRPVVYYQLKSNKGSKRELRLSSDETPVPVSEVDFLKIRYFFYYPRDTGTNGHENDVEGVEISVRAAPWRLAGENCVRLFPTTVRAFAHGLLWSANNLHLQDDLACDAALPMTVLVEEGKHASCPDRNADGLYTPGYDVNVSVRDAWGVRDDFGSARVHSRYLSESAKHRRSADRLFPPLTQGPVAAHANNIRAAYNARARQDQPWDPEQSYELKGAVGAWRDFSTTADTTPHLGHLAGKLREQEFGERWGRFRRLYTRFLRERVSVEFPLGRGEALVSPNLSFLKELPIADGWLTVAPAFAPRDRFAVRAIDVIYSRTASTPLDWYLLERLTGKDGAPNVSRCCSFNTEFGFKIRFQQAQIPILKKIPTDAFLGIRVGVEVFRQQPVGPYGIRFRGAIGGGSW